MDVLTKDQRHKNMKNIHGKDTKISLHNYDKVNIAKTHTEQIGA